MALDEILTPADADLPHTVPFEIASNKPFIQASIDGSTPQWFILDTGCRGNSMTIRVVSVQPGTPAANANLQVGDELVSIDGVKTPELKVDEARALLRSPGVRRLELKREGKLLAVRLGARRLV